MPPTPDPNQPELTIEGLQAQFAGQGHAERVSVIQDEQGQSYLFIPPPGIAIQDIRAFLKSTLADLGDAWDILPASLPVDGVRLSSFMFSATAPFVLEFTVDWLDAHWEMIPGVLALASPSIAIYITGKADAYDRVRVSGTVAGVVEIESIPLFIELELPSGAFEVQLLMPGEAPGAEAKRPNAGALLNTFQVGGAPGQGENGAGIDLGVLALQDLTILGSVPARRLFLHLALGHIPLGPGELAAQLTIDYFGGPNGQVSGQVWGEYDILKKGSTDILFSLLLVAAYDGPGKNWKFEGGAASAGDKAVTIKELIGAFTDTDGIPGVFDQLAIRSLHLTYETGPGNFEFECDVEVHDLFGAGATVEMVVSVRLHKAGAATGRSAGYEKTFSGQLLFKLEDGTTLEFDLLFDQSPHGQTSDTAFIAAYKSPSGGDLDIGDLIRIVEPELDVPLSIALKDAFFIYDKQAGRSHSLFGLDIGGGIDLSALPLVGKVVPKEASLTFGLQPLVALGAPDANQVYFSDSDLTRLGALIPGGGITLPNRAIKEPIGLGINVALGQDTTFHFDLPIRLKSKVQTKPAAPALPATAALPSNPPAEQAIEKTGGQVTTSPAAQGVTPAPAGSSASGIQWIKIGKAFGPVHINRLGLQFESDTQMVWAYLDASLSLAALTFSLDGLGLGTPINKLEPQFRLLGIGVDFKKGALEIGASFLHSHIAAVMAGDREVMPAYDEYSGLATIKTPSLTLSAIGAYADLPDYNSLFIYAVLHAPLGGPSFFFVTGLAAGFGFNRAVRLPEVSAVGQFPLVNLATGGAGSPAPTNPTDRTDTIHDILDQLRDSIYPMKGQYFLAAGIRFTSFQLIDSFALLIVSFGEHFEIDVLGLSTVIVPTPVAGGQEVTPIAEVQLALKAVFNPAEGILSIEAQLTANSFVLSRDCHLTGGFAFYCWFAGPHQGEFVLSLGGYHPTFQKPAHYPTVPRLGLNWPVNSELSIKGGIYFALLPHMVMAGGRLEALYQSGAQKAWFTLAADFLVCWKPYHYDARASLDIGVEYTYHLFGAHQIKVSVGAEVHIWGPEFAGHAHIHLWCVTFDMDFGATTTPKLEPVDWATFNSSFLPPDKTKMAQISVMAGLLRRETVRVDGADVEQHVINPSDFHLGLDLVMPYASFTVDAAEEVIVKSLQQATVKGGAQIVPFREVDGRYSQTTMGRPVSTGSFGIAPMARSAGQITSRLQLTVEAEDAGGQWQPAGRHFGFRPVLKRVPRALWGEKLQQDLNGERYAENVMAGMELTPAAPPRPGETQWIARQDLAYATTHVEPGIGFEPLTAFAAGELAANTAATDYLRTHLTDVATMSSRRQLLTALGFDYDRLGISLSPEIADALVMDPQIGTLV
ncbi:MAG: hypothetical protein IPH95_17120 [Candidatus Promineofilum sp.]|nr:hypothetical protein [Promineifilum sp.]